MNVLGRKARRETHVGVCEITLSAVSTGSLSSNRISTNT
jgi:hypothetical protein